MLILENLDACIFRGSQLLQMHRQTPGTRGQVMQTNLFFLPQLPKLIWPPEFEVSFPTDLNNFWLDAICLIC